MRLFRKEFLQNLRLFYKIRIEKCSGNGALLTVFLVSRVFRKKVIYNDDGVLFLKKL